jgi:hypothetical protein
MPRSATSLRARLKKAGVRHYDVLIHDQPKDWLLQNFSSRSKKHYSINVSKLMRNIVWQLRERILSKEKPPLRELLRTFWYMYIKPTLSRAAALSSDTDQYAQLISNIVFMVKDAELMEYKDIGFRDDNQANRRLGGNANIILFSEKLGHQDFLSDIANKYNISIVALGGQPSVLNVEYFVDTMRAAGVNLKRSFYLFSIVDYDTSGWIIRDAFVDDLRFYGISHTQVIDLIHPDMLTAEEVKLARFEIPKSEAMRVKNKDWLKEVHQRNYKNQIYLEEQRSGTTTLFGLEAEAVSGQRLAEKLDQEMLPLLGQSEDLLKIFELKKLDQSIKDLILFKIT